MDNNPPPFLKKNDLIRFVGTSRSVAEPQTITESRIFLESYGYNVQIANAVNQKYHQWSGNDETRLLELQIALDCAQTRAICCVRGGHGTTRILPFLDWCTFAKSPKWIVGFSDITALLLAALPYNAGIHASMPALYSQDIASAKSLVSVLEGNIIDYQWNGLAIRYGNAKGKVIAANLSMLCDSLGTAAEPDFSGIILILEEVGEYYYKIDRMFSQLYRAGMFDKIAGLVLGGFDNIPDSEQEYGYSIVQIISRYAGIISKIPIVFGFPLGHQKPNLAIRLGEKLILSAQQNQVFRLYSAPNTIEIS